MIESVKELCERKQFSRSWRKSRIAARLLRREDPGKIVPRDVALGKKLAIDPAVTPRLISHALGYLSTLRR